MIECFNPHKDIHFLSCHIACLTFSSLENLPTSRKHMETNKANMEEDLKQRRGDTAQNQGNLSVEN